MNTFHHVLGTGLLLLLAGCSLLPGTDPVDGAGASAADHIKTNPWARACTLHASGKADNAAWTHRKFPGKAPSQYSYVRLDGREAMFVTSQRAASMLRRVTRVEPDQLGSVNFSWKVSELIESANMNLRDKSDSPVRLVLAFEGDRSRFSARDAMLSELALTLTGEEMPYATLMYVWSNHDAAEKIVPNHRTSRIRKLVVESGRDRLNRWVDYERDVRADYEKAFGEAPGALVAVGIMTDTDNTQASAQAWYGPISLSPLSGKIKMP